MITLTAAALGVKTIAKKIPWQVWACSGLVLVLFYTHYKVYRNGQEEVQDRWDATIKAGKAVVAEVEKSGAEVTATTITKYVYKTNTIRVKGDVIEKQIPIYIPVSTPDLPGGFRLLHDAAATSQVPSQADLPGQPVPVGEATATITRNYTTCLIWRAELDSWNEWYQEQLLVWQSAQRKLQ